MQTNIDWAFENADMFQSPIRGNAEQHIVFEHIITSFISIVKRKNSLFATVK